jgi:HEAT repeat protein
LLNINEEPTIREAAIEIVGELSKNNRQGTTLEPLLWALNGTDDQIRIKAARAVRLIGDDKLIRDIYDGLRYTADPEAQEEVVRALGRLGRDAIPFLIDVLNDKHIGPRARAKAARSLGNMGLIEEVWLLLDEKAQDASSDFKFREGIMEALTWLKPQRRNLLAGIWLQK